MCNSNSLVVIRCHAHLMYEGREFLSVTAITGVKDLEQVYSCVTRPKDSFWKPLRNESYYQSGNRKLINEGTFASHRSSDVKTCTHRKQVFIVIFINLCMKLNY